ncbi:zinc-finger homeodomain protein 6-like [Hibiscus syriacus]|uniref:zinc-finger homeodomain protein 6-like n=1 Tax=Hibiscus syriacus TaxID=106335 RepID=UPI001921204A|nr:zinc-finger homeodomain protein 6-like [Hibiscus syriacus]
MGTLSSFIYNTKLITEPRTLDDHHNEPNPQHRIDNPGQQPAPVPQHPTEDGPLIRYRECLKNHAANMGCYVVDGCGKDGTGEALKCAACECHRNFHRKETDGGAFPYYKNNTRRPTPLRRQRCPPGLSNSTTPRFRVAPHVTTNSGGGNGGVRAESSSEDLNVFAGGRDSSHLQPPKKRFRTKFSEDQKDKMREFADKLGWRIQKQDEPEVQQFCGDVGVKRPVFKVSMHNSKQAMKRKQM